MKFSTTSLLALALGANIVTAATLVQQQNNQEDAAFATKRELQTFNGECRCEASWENLYNRRLEAERQQSIRQRQLIHHFNYNWMFS